MGAEMFSKGEKKRRTRQSVLRDRQGTGQEIGKIYDRRYQVLKMLGMGGTGKVFLALDQKTGKEVAVKIVKDQKQWERERVILRKLSYVKGVPELFSAGKEEELFLVMEYILGDSLKQYRRICGKLRKKEMLLWMIKICKVLDEIHQQGIIHMDLKPENIMLTRTGKVYLIDFGTALFEGEKLSGYGTKNYASKKQSKTEEKAQCYFDVYSFGKTMESIFNESNDVKKVIEKCLAVDEEAENEKERYQNVRQIQNDLEKILWFGHARKSLILLVIILGSGNLWNQTQREDQRERKVIEQKKSQEEIEKAMTYFYGNDQTKRDEALAEAYFKKCVHTKKNAKSYLLLLEVMNGRKNDLQGEDLMGIVRNCQKDIYDFWSAYFYLHFYTVNVSKLPEDAWKEAEKILKQMQKYSQKKEYQKLVETDRINLYESEAEKGDDRKFLEETDRIFHERFEGNAAWKLYERKLIYLESKQSDISREFERFLKKYPKVMDAYVEYGIYLCRSNKITEAQRVYQQGKEQTGMTSKRAEELRRKLGL